MSSKELAQRTGLTAVTITRLEKFRNEPEPETVDALVKALEFPKEFFFGPDVDELNKDAASFRSLTSMTAKERRNHQIINGQRRKRIAKGSGTTVEEVNRLLGSQ